MTGRTRKRTVTVMHGGTMLMKKEVPVYDDYGNVIDMKEAASAIMYHIGKARGVKVSMLKAHYNSEV